MRTQGAKSGSDHELKSRGGSQRNLALLFVASTEYVAPAWQNLRQREFDLVFRFQLIEEL